MTRLLTSIKRLVPRRLRRAAYDESGNSTIDFVIVFPIFMIVFLSAVELGIYMLRQVMMERSVDIAMRDLRLGIGGAPTHDELKEIICSRGIINFQACVTNTLIELQPVSTDTWTPIPAANTCNDRSEEIQPVTNFLTGGENELMIVRVCTTVQPWFYLTGPGLGMPLIDGQNYALITSSAFVNEPGS